MDYDNSNIPLAYDTGREISDNAKRKFLEFFTNRLSDQRINKIVDLGCGTGRFSGVLAELFGAEVVGVDPSEKMLAQAIAKYDLENISFKRGNGEKLPLDNNSIDMVFMSMVFHHLEDPQKTALECQRVLPVGGTVCLRNTFADEISSYPYLDIFPSIGSIIESQLVSRQTLKKIFSFAGFELLAHQVVWDQISPNWWAFAEKLQLKADSFVARLDEKEFQSGLLAMGDKIKSKGGENPVGLNVDSFIFRKI